MPITKKTKTGYSTDARSLESLKGRKELKVFRKNDSNTIPTFSPMVGANCDITEGLKPEGVTTTIKRATNPHQYRLLKFAKAYNAFARATKSLNKWKNYQNSKDVDKSRKYSEKYLLKSIKSQKIHGKNIIMKKYQNFKAETKHLNKL